MYDMYQVQMICNSSITAVHNRYENTALLGAEHESEGICICYPRYEQETKQTTAADVTSTITYV